MRSYLLGLLFLLLGLISGFAQNIVEQAIISRLFYLQPIHDESAHEPIVLDPTHLWRYITEGDVDAVSLIIDQSPINWNQVDDQGNNLFNIAVRRGDVPIVDLLLQQQGLDFNHANNHGYTPLIQAVARKNLSIIKLLLASGRVDPNRSTFDGMSSLLIATCSRQFDIVALLLEYGADVNQEDAYGLNAYWFAAHFNDRELQDLLRGYGAIVDDYVDGYEHTLLHECVYQGYFLGIRQLLRQQNAFRVNAINVKGDSPLMVAIRREDLACVKILLREGAHIDFQNYNTRETPLHVAVFYNHMGIFEVILKRAHDLDKTDALGLTPLMLAMYLQKTPVAKALIRKGADMAYQRLDGMRIWDIAEQTKNWRMMKFLLKRGYGPNVRSI